MEVPTSRTAMSAVDVREAAARAAWYRVVTRGCVEAGSGRRPLVRALNRVLSSVPAAERPPALPPHETVSVVVATRDRPDDLQRCLASLVRQRTCRSVEIIVVDNNPSSRLTPAVTAGFPAVRLVAEPRPGLSYARNAGILRSRGRIIVSTDDDVVVPEDWIERLVAPFAHDEVMVVTGNVLPQALDDVAQRRFEAYGGLSRGFDSIEFDGDRMRRCRRAIPTWRLGSTANAAFRASIFADPRIGLIDEALGAGMPSGCSEDTYVFYKVLKAGYRIVYEPRAYVWHRHRASSAAFRRQLFNYSKGHVAYHLTTLIRDHDPRAVIRLAIDLPMAHASRVYHRLRGWTDYPVTLVLLEVIGNLVGPWALWQSRRRVRRFGPSGPLLEQSVDRDGVTIVQVPGRVPGE
jgi:GT2 family glycosyltransferase